MPYELVMPALSADTNEGVVVAWFKREGSEVRAGERLLEVQLAKVSYEVPAPTGGTLHRILAPQDAIIREGQVLALILQPGEAVPPAPVASAPALTPVAAVVEAPPASEVRASPLARRIAREHNIALENVRGTGAGGRISEEDVRAAIAAGSAPNTGAAVMRRTIARRMLESLQSMAQLTLISEADVTELAEWRQSVKGRLDVTVTDLVIKAVALALRAHPQLNARWSDGGIQPQPDIHIGIAVALAEGLIVPVVHHADSKNLLEIGAAVKSLAERARAGALSGDDVAGGTFSVTNLGTYGVDGFTPIINPPNAAVLGMGRIAEKAARREGQLAWRQALTLSLTFDHRVVDGAPAAAFLQSVRETLEHPAELIAAAG